MVLFLFAHSDSKMFKQTKENLKNIQFNFEITLVKPKNKNH